MWNTKFHALSAEMKGGNDGDVVAVMFIGMCHRRCSTNTRRFIIIFAALDAAFHCDDVAFFCVGIDEREAMKR